MIGRLALIGRLLFAACIVAFGIQNLYYTGYVKGLEITPEWAPWHTFWAYLDGVLLIAGGVSIGIQVWARRGAVIVAAVYFASVIFLRLPRIGLTIHDIGERTLLLEPLAIACGALFVAAMFLPAARVLFGITMMIFGVAHLQIPRFIASLIFSRLRMAT